MDLADKSPATGARYVAIDGLRFVAALAIVLHHYASMMESPFWDGLFSKNYLFVDFFFAISGFVIFHNYAAKLDNVAAYGDFLKNRIARVYPLHLLTFLFYLLLAATLWRAKADRAFVDPAAILPNLLMVHAWGTTSLTTFNYPSWSISAEWFAYLLFPAVVWLLRRGGALAALGAALAIVGALEVAAFLGVIKPWTTLTFHMGALRAMPTFLVGAALAHALPRLSLPIASFMPAVGLFLAAGLAMFVGLNDRFIVLLLIACLVTAVVAERNGARGALTGRLAARLGDYSYALYMIHPLIAVLLVNFVGGKMLRLAGTPLILWCFFCAIVPNILAAALIYNSVERPARHWIRHFNPFAIWRSIWGHSAHGKRTW